MNDDDKENAINIEQSIHIEINNQELTLTKAEAELLYDKLKDLLNKNDKVRIIKEPYPYPTAKPYKPEYPPYMPDPFVEPIITCKHQQE